MAFWKKFIKNRKFEYFEEEKEKNWGGPFYFIQGADIQFGFISRELDNDEVITWDKENILAESMVEKINQMNPRPKFFVMCGDLCDAMPDTELELRKKQEIDYKRIFAKLDKSIPLINVCGNHDVGNTPTADTIQMYQSSFGSDYFSFICGGVLFLVINSQYFFDSSMVQDLAEKHNLWIDEKLQEAQSENMRVVVFQHIPWFLKSIEENPSYFTLHLDLRKKWLKKFKEAGVEAVFCGHFHRNAGGIYNGIDVVVTSAVGGQLGNDKSGARIVHVKENKIEHNYYDIKNLPITKQFPSVPTIQSAFTVTANKKEAQEDVAEKFNDKNVKELESLKNIFGESEDRKGSGNVISISKSQISSFSDVNGLKSKQMEIKNTVDRNGEVFVKVSQKIDFLKNNAEEPRTAVQTEIDIPSKGIHHVIKNDANVDSTYEKKEELVESKRTGNEVNKMNSFSKTNYSPHDMAEYIFWTGDEKGVALTIEEFLRERLMSRQEAINFLQSIKYDLDLMQSQYQRLGKADEKIFSKGVSNFRRRTQSKEEFVENPKEYLYEEQLNSAKLKPTDFLNVESDPSENTSADIGVKKKTTYLNKLNFTNDSNGRDYFEKKKSYSELLTTAKTFDGYVSDRDYDETMERVKMLGLLQKENSLEEFIFELSKLMFSESLKNGNTEAQKAMQRFSAYLQTQVNNGRISENLQKKIFEILLAALMDALPEHPELLNRPIDELKVIFDPSSPTSVALKQLITLGISRLTDQSDSKEKHSGKTLLLSKKKLSKELL